MIEIEGRELVIGDIVRFIFLLLDCRSASNVNRRAYGLQWAWTTQVILEERKMVPADVKILASLELGGCIDEGRSSVLSVDESAITGEPAADKIVGDVVHWTCEAKVGKVYGVVCARASQSFVGTSFSGSWVFVLPLVSFFFACILSAFSLPLLNEKNMLALHVPTHPSTGKTVAPLLAHNNSDHILTILNICTTSLALAMFSIFVVCIVFSTFNLRAGWMSALEENYTLVFVAIYLVSDCMSVCQGSRANTCGTQGRGG